MTGHFFHAKIRCSNNPASCGTIDIENCATNCGTMLKRFCSRMYNGIGTANFRTLPRFFFILLLLPLPALLPAQTPDPTFCRELLDKARTALNARDWNKARDYCETALPLCPGLAGDISAVMNAVTDGVDKEKEVAIKNAELAKRKEREAAAERDKAQTALTNLEKANADVVKLILENADRDILKLEYEAALQKIKAAASLGALKEETARHYLEIAFWHGEAGNLDRAKNILDSAAMLVNKTATLKQPFRESIKAFAPDVYDKLMERYYPVMVPVEGGTFDMGCDPGETCKDLHKQEVSSFQMAEYETTWWQYYLFCKATEHEYESPGWGTDGDNPAVNVSWFDAVLYLNWVNKQSGLDTFYIVENKREGNYGDYYDVTLNPNAKKGYRLPTEAEWEFAAKGGKNPDNTVYSGSKELGEVAWFSDNSGSRTHPVGSPDKKANALGLFDMSGNVYEWCWDWYGSYEVDPPKDHIGKPIGSYRVFRGGSWFNDAEFCRTAYRYDDYPVRRRNSLGFRLVFVP